MVSYEDNLNEGINQVKKTELEKKIRRKERLNSFNVCEREREREREREKKKSISP